MKIYIGNLSFNTTEEILNNTFSEYGLVESVYIIKDKDSEKSKGFGFVEMPDTETALKAIEELNGKNLDGRKLRVNPAKEMAPKKSRQY
jgi:RNA recognition motif-containing protein